MHNNIEKPTALQAAELLGLSIIKRGARSWAICPFHAEQTASLLFNNDGTWHCFGCGKHGDAISLYAKVKGITASCAAKEIGVPRYHGLEMCSFVVSTDGPQKAIHLKKEVDHWVESQYKKANQWYRLAQMKLDMANDDRKWAIYHGEDYEPGPEFDICVSIASQSRLRMEELYTQDPHTLMIMILEERSNEWCPTV